RGTARVRPSRRHPHTRSGRIDVGYNQGIGDRDGTCRTGGPGRGGRASMTALIPSLSFAGGTLVLHAMAAAELRRTFAPGLWRWDSRVEAWRCDALDYMAVRRALTDSGRPFNDTVPGWSRVRWPSVQLHPLRL